MARIIAWLGRLRTPAVGRIRTVSNRLTDIAGGAVWWAVAAFLVVVSVVGTWCIDGFGGNLLAEAVGVAASVPVTVLVVEAVLDRRRERDWRSVRRQTGNSIKSVAQEAAADFHLALTRTQRQAQASPVVMPAGGTATSLRETALKLRARRTENDVDTAAVNVLADNVQRSAYNISAMAPRIYASGDPALAQLFGAFEQEVRAWERARYYETLDPAALWERAAGTAEALAGLVEHAEQLADSPIDRRWRANVDVAPVADNVR